MKTTSVSVLLFLIIFTSCIEEPNALFTIENKDHYWTYENIQLNNSSTNAESFNWDFDNGKYSGENFPVIFYEESGDYIITLIAYSKNEKFQDTYSQSINIIQPTDLSIKIFRVLTDTLTVSNAKVTLYKTYEDWIDYSNKIDSLFSDQNGLVFFRNIEAITYYVDVYKPDEEEGFWTNWNSGYKTDALKENQINYYPVILEHFSAK
ncbi:hypothetical protein ACFLTE_11420 [Bacteroidota bacterium]